MKIAINTAIDFKPDPVDKVSFKILTTRFSNVDISVEQLAQHIALGHAFCAQHKNERRAAINFLAMDFLAVDIDEGWTVEEAIADTFVRDHASIIYHTVSSHPVHHRFRIIFLMPRTIIDAQEMTSAYTGLIKKFGGDVTCRDATRMFFGNKGCTPIVFGNTLSVEELDKLIAAGERKLEVETLLNAQHQQVIHSSMRSKYKLSDAQKVQLADKSWVLLSDIQDKRSVHCPSPDHHDAHASAFVVKSRNGSNGVHCSKCQETMWPVEYFLKKQRPYNFFEVDRFFKNIEDAEDFEEYEINGSFPDDGEEYYQVKRIVNAQESRFLNEIPLQKGFVAIKSPKGTGKSHSLKRIVDACKSKNLSVILFGHRQSLLEALSSDLGLDYYRDESLDRRVTDHYAVCLDSIPTRIGKSKRTFDVVIIDESEQVLTHLTSDTLKSRRRQCFLMLKHIIESAQTVIACDADLGFLTLETITEARPHGEMPKIYVNRFGENHRQIDIYASQNHLIQDLIEAVKSGGIHYVCSNSKRQAHDIGKTLREAVGDHLKIQMVTSDNSAELKVKDFLKNIKTQILEVDVLIASPSMGTGIDISFENQESKVKGVFGFFGAHINTHQDMDQQLCRVRNPEFVKCFITHESFNFETEVEVIKQDCVNNGDVTDTLLGYDKKFYPIYNNDDAMLNLYAKVKSERQASMNNLRKNFIDYKKYNGWMVEEIPTNTELAAIGAKAIKIGKEKNQAASTEQILNADILDQEQVNKLKKKAYLTSSQNAQVERFFLQSFYGEVTSEIIMLDNKGKFRRQIRMMQTFIEDDEHLRIKDENEVYAESERESEWTRHIGDRSHHLRTKLLLVELFSSADLLDDKNRIIEDKMVCRAELGAFIRTCKKLNLQVQSVLGVAIRTDIDKDPVTQLKNFLRLIGVGVTAATRKRSKESQSQHYGIDVDSLRKSTRYANKQNEKIPRVMNETVKSRQLSKVYG